MPTIKGILNFPNLFTAKIAKGATEAKFSCGILLPANDPQIPAIQAEVDQAKLNTFPSGYTGSDECFGLYEVKIPPSKDYHDPRFIGWYLLTANAKVNDKPAVVDMNHQFIVDPSAVFGGMIGYISLNIYGYPKGKGGVGGGLNGVMVTAEEPPFGRLDGKPSVEQMFANVNAAAPPVAPPIAPPAAPPVAPPIAPPAAPPAAPPIAPPIAPPAAPPIAPPAAPPAQLIMTASANGMTYDQYIAAGWTDEQMISNGIAQKPSFG